ncbi:sigma-54-dependent Fis family transcriptional regulator [Lutispora saccharofermentans]|uniref:Sigma 54-interacting transcriptional regulator n=1 Tax=Lutispora saccharofermentans TaxID=3024236 RepID=A0ABT1NCH7_9FIRM|nr:sigma 54-interacting transcriptional regulator [Lutispora saccharofermentans]MCQ1528952.1 sigma 54-interacting transcriptional regulator [Lutispora saccharofermentans]
MSYLKLIDDKIQSLAESLSSILNVETTVVDSSLLRIAGTGDFYHRINESSPENSLFAKVLKNGKPEFNIYEKDNAVCRSCSYGDTCKERKSMIYPIKVEEENIGVVCFASFNQIQDQLMLSKKEEYMEMLKHFAESIEKEIISIKMINKLNMGIAEINGVINSINRCIIILNKEQRIIHINSKAIRILNINFSASKIINRKISDIIKNFKVEDTNNKELVGNWTIENRILKVLYKVNYIILDKKNISTLIDFDALDEIINIAVTYNNDNVITFENIVGCSQVMQEVIDKAKIAAKSDSTIFLYGASGTGKELFARSIHNASFRKDGPFIAINCATLPENLIESELFGYEKGSFTGASPKGKIGKFEQANNGTLFLDEIADLPLHLQAKLLRVLQEKKIDRIGSTTPTDINVRIISATHKNLQEMVRKNQFREDLYYRLNVIPLSLPSLKEREEDVLLCTEYIIKKLCNKMNKPQKYISKDIEEKFLSYSWPGNVRELENVLEYAINFSNDDEIGEEDLPEYFLNNIAKTETKHECVDIEAIDINSLRSLDEMTRDYEKKILKRLLDLYGDTTEGKRTIAKKLNMSITTLYRKLNDY